MQNRVTKQSARGLAENLLSMKELTPLGASAAQIRACVSWLRDCAENFEAAWQVLGLTGDAHIHSYVHTASQMPDGTSVIYFGASEPTGKSGMVPTVIDQNGRVATDQSGMDWMAFGPDLSKLGTPGELRDLTIRGFFDGAVLITPEVSASRFDAIEFAAYELGVVHSHIGRYQNKNPEKMAAFSALHQLQPVHQRDNADYLILSIARDLSRADDVDRLIAASLLFS